MTVSHPSMRRAKTEPKKETPPKQVYVVENATNQVDIVEANEQAAMQKKQQEVTESTKSTSLIEDLLFLGRARKEVAIGKLKFEISTLTQNESAELMKEIYRTKDGADLFAVRSLTLSYAIRSVNNIEFDEVPLESTQEEAEFETARDKKMAILGKMQKNVVEKLHEEYVELVENSENALEGSGEEVKNL